VKFGADPFALIFATADLKEAIALELGNELLVRNGRLLPAFDYDGQIFKVFQKFFVVGDGDNDRRAFAAIVGNVLYGIAHDWRIAESNVVCNPDACIIEVRLRETPNQHARRARSPDALPLHKSRNKVVL